MSGSQQSFESKLNRLVNGVDLLSSWADYNPNNNQIKAANLVIFTNDVNAANVAVNNTLIDLNELRDERVLKCFTQPKNINPDCFEARVRGIRNYLQGEDFPAAEARAIEKILLKIHPRYPKKVVVPPGQPQPKHPSPSEKSFAALVSNGHAIINRITGLAAAYNPPDANISVANFTALVNDIVLLNKNVQLALDAYGTANRARKKLYTGPGSLAERTTQVKSYLGSFAGQKKSDHYIEFRDAIKGT